MHSLYRLIVNSFNERYLDELNVCAKIILQIQQTTRPWLFTRPDSIVRLGDLRGLVLDGH